MARQFLVDIDMNNVGKVTNLAAPTNPNDAARLTDLNAAIEGLAWKDNVRAASTANINLASPGATIDGVTMVSGDRFLAKDQSSIPTNGIYIWNGAATPATRSSDASTFDELENAVVSVDEGTTNAGTTWRQTQVNGTIGVNNIVFTTFGVSPPAASETTPGVIEIATQAETNTGTDDARAVTPLKLASYTGFIRKYSADVGDGSNTSYTITHNLGSRDVLVQVYRNSGSYDEIVCDVQHTTTNTVTLVFLSAPTSNQFRVVVTG